MGQQARNGRSAVGNLGIRMESQINNSSSLRRSVRAYDISFKIELGETESRGRVVNASFLLDLRGRHNRHGSCGGARCPACIHVLRSLLGVADAIWPLKQESLARAGYDCESRVHFAAAEGRGSEVVLGLEIRVRPPCARATNGWASALMEDINAALMELGCRGREGVGSVNTRPGPQPIETERPEPGAVVPLVGTESQSNVVCASESPVFSTTAEGPPSKLHVGRIRARSEGRRPSRVRRLQ